MSGLVIRVRFKPVAYCVVLDLSFTRFIGGHATCLVQITLTLGVDQVDVRKLGEGRVSKACCCMLRAAAM